MIYETFLRTNGEKYSLRYQFSLIGDIGDKEYLNSTVEEYKVICPHGTFSYIKKDDFYRCAGHCFVSKFLRKT